jgi:hypothetical protein
MQILKDSPMTTTVTLTADDVRASVSMPEAIDAMRRAFLDLDAGAFEQPTRMVRSSVPASMPESSRYSPPLDIPQWFPLITGMAYRTGEHRFEIDPADELGHGFVLR